MADIQEILTNFAKAIAWINITPDEGADRLTETAIKTATAQIEQQQKDLKDAAEYARTVLEFVEGEYKGPAEGAIELIEAAIKEPEDEG